MLPREAMQLAKERTNLDYADREAAVAKEVGQIRAEMSGRGVLFSSMTVHRIKELIVREYEVRALLAWTALARALSASNLTISGELGDELKAAIRNQVESGSGDLRRHLEEASSWVRGAGGFDLEGELQRATDRALARVSSEIDFAFLEAGRQRGTESAGPVFNVYSPIGVIQTGPGANASVRMSFRDEDRQQLLGALRAVERALLVSGVPAEVQAQITEAVVAARSEASKSQPNPLTLRGMLAGIGTAVQTLGSAREAYQALKVAAALVGVQLP